MPKENPTIQANPNKATLTPVGHHHHNLDQRKKRNLSKAEPTKTPKTLQGGMISRIGKGDITEIKTIIIRERDKPIIGIIIEIKEINERDSTGKIVIGEGMIEHRMSSGVTPDTANSLIGWIGHTKRTAHSLNDNKEKPTMTETMETATNEMTQDNLPGKNRITMIKPSQIETFIRKGVNKRENHNSLGKERTEDKTMLEPRDIKRKNRVAKSGSTRSM